MINRRTLFILGAGASMPYGLPSGDELRRYLSMPWEQSFSNMQTTIEKLFQRGDEVRRFGLEFLKSKQVSIDTFLAKRPDLSDIGKLCIAYQINIREQPNLIRKPADANDDWYMYLWRAMQHDAARPEDILTNNVKFLTFNYDRSLEHFLHEAIKHSFGIDDEAAFAVSRSIPVLHPYGLLAEFSPTQTANAAPYRPHVDEAEALRTAQQFLRIIPEARDNDPCFERGREWFAWAERVCFLGFSFDPLNLERLGFHRVLRNMAAVTGQPGPPVYASAYGLEQAELNGLSHYFMNTNDRVLLQEKNLMFLRKTNFLGEVVL